MIMKYRMYILPDPMLERLLIPTQVEFELEEDVDNYIAYDLEKFKEEEKKKGYYGWYDEDSVVEVTFLKVY